MRVNFTNGPYDPLADNQTVVLPGPTTPYTYLLHIDAQISEARRTGRRVILTLNHPPAWENGIWSQVGDMPVGRSPWQAPPWWVDPSSWFAFVVAYLAIRYNKLLPNVGDRWVDFLEIANEPNLQWWPQRSHGGGRHLHLWAARMLWTARIITRELTLNEPIILGPGMSDADDERFDQHDVLKSRAFSEFMPAMLDEVRRLDDIVIGPTDDARTAWSHHNYFDVKNGLSGGNNRARRARDILASRGWNGWRDADNSSILITEGGVTPADAQLEGSFQNRLVEEAWNRMQSGSEGASVGMMTNYLMWSEAPPNSMVLDNDVGLLRPPTCLVSEAQCGPASNPGPERAVFDVWRDLPTTYPR